MSSVKDAKLGCLSSTLGKKMSSFRLSHLGHLYTFPLGWATCMYMYILALVKMYIIYTVPIRFRVASALGLVITHLKNKLDHRT